MIDVYRFEFIFLNPEEGRWQMFQEAPSEQATNGAAVYRREAQNILGWIRKTVEKLCKERADTFRVSGPNPEGSVELNLEYLQRQLEKTAKEVTPIFWKQVYAESLKAIKHAMDHTIALEKIESFASGKCDEIFDALALGRRASRTIKLTSDEARALISTLYSARHWDLFGRLSFPGPDKKNEAWFSPALVRHFSYCLNWAEQGVSPSHTEKALGYDVQIALRGQASGTPEPPPPDAAAKTEGAAPAQGKLTPYYSFCHDVVEKEETFWYCFNGLLVDALTSGLSGRTPESPPTAPVYVTCLPIRICGYDHFLQLYWKSDQQDPPLSIENTLAHATKQFSSLFGKNFVNTGVPMMLPLKECLRELLVQMHVAAFQHHVLAELKKSNRTKQRKTDELVDSLFCSHAPNLVKMEEIIHPTRSGWFHYVKKPPDERAQTRSSNKKHVTGSKDEIFKTWMFDKKDVIESKIHKKVQEEHVALVMSPSGAIKIFVPWEEVFDGSLNPLFGGTGQDRLQEQYEWLSRIVRFRIAMLDMAGKMRSVVIES